MPTAETDKLTELSDYIELVMDGPSPHSQLIAVLHKTQQLYGYLPTDVMDEIAHRMQIPTAHIWGVATFYHYFNLNPPGKHTISVCLGTACYVKGAGDILQRLRDELKIELGETTADGMFSLQPARCLGACGLAPVVMIDETIHGELTGDKMMQIIDQYRTKTDE